MDRQPVLTGERLVLRPLAPQDWDALWAVAEDRELWAMHPAHDRWQEPVFRAFFADALAHGGALLAIERGSGGGPGCVVGSSRFQGYREADGGRVEIGWSFLARDRWGTGLNAAMKRLMLVHAFRFVDRVEFRIGEENWRSRRAMEKIGGRLTGELDLTHLGGADRIHVIYAIDRTDFAAGPLAA